jgi:hypothetical protein
VTRRATLGVLAAGVVAVVAVLLLIGGESDDNPKRPPQPPPATTPPAGPLELPPPARYAAERPDRALASFMLAWHDRDWGRMLASTTRSWRMEAGAPRAALVALFAGKLPRAYSVRRRVLNPGNAHFEVLVQYAGKRAPRGRQVLSLNLLREGPSGVIVATGGRWGVDPRSVTVVRR